VPGDSIVRSPAPIIRSNTDWVKRTSLMFSSGISMDFLANQPERWMSRSVVTTKCDVAHATIRRRASMRKRRTPTPTTAYRVHEAQESGR